MDISLNIAKPSAARRPAKPLPKSGPGQKKKKVDVNDFSFNFTTDSKVKALVAKRRNPQLMLKKAEQNQVKFLGMKPVVTRPVPLSSSKSNITMPPKTASATPVVEENISLSLNVVTGTEQDRVQTIARLEKRGMNSKQRKELMLEKRAKAYQQQELSAPPVRKTVTPKDVLIAAESVAEESGEIVKQFKPQQQSNRLNSGQTKPKQFKEKSKKMSSLFANNPVVPVIGQRLVNPRNETVFTGALMNTIGLHDHAVKNLADILKITELTTVQQRTVPIVLSGRDVLVRSQTGSGKTLAYALPIVQKLQEIRPKLTRDGGIQALVIVPTRELAIQSYELFIKLLKPFTWIVSGYLTGGEKRKAEKARLRKGINILVGTPGRLCDHLLHTESFKLDQVKWLVLDEADRLFEMGYEKDVKKIVDVLNENATKPEEGSEPKNPFAKKEPVVRKSSDSSLQSMLLSATLTSSVRQLAGLALKDPMFIDTSDVNDADILKSNTFEEAIDEAVAEEKIVIPATVSQSYILVPPKLRLVTLSGLIAHETKKSDSAKMLIFLGTEHLVDFHFDVMNEALTRKVLDSDDEDEEGEEEEEDEGEQAILKGVRFFKLHGSLTQQERSAVFKAFKETKSGVLLTTDVAARGIDVPLVDLVVQFSPPQKISDYVHRVGRTARAGRSGRAIMFLSPNETDFIRMLEDKKIRISQDDSNKYLKGVVRDSSTATTLEESASELQRKFEGLVADDKEMHDRACKAFVSWLRFIAAFPKDLRAIFNIKQAHMGHYAKSLGLREPPKSVTKMHSAPKPSLPTNRLTYSERSEKRKADPKMNKDAQKRPNSGNLNFNKFVKKSISLTTSEFGSGMPPQKKKKSN